MTQSQEPTNQPTPQEQEDQKSTFSTMQPDLAQLERVEPQTTDVSASEVASTGMSRRKLLTVGASMAAAFALPRIAQANTNQKALGTLETAELPESVATLAQVNPTNITIPFGTVFSSPANFNPPTVNPGTNALTLNMDSVQVSVTQSNGTTANYGTFRAYSTGSGSPAIPGPSFMVQDGQTLQLTVNNNLPPNPDNQNNIGSASANDPFCGVDNMNNRPQCFNTGNIHFHGLHVSPSTQQANNISSDDVFVSLQPGDPPHQYAVALPVNHAPGTHWYHPHQHGSTGAEVSNALAGAIIIGEKSGQTVYPGQINAQDAGTATDWIWVMQELTNNATATPDLSVYQGGGSGVFIVNGQYQPQLNLKTDTVHRFRFINGTSTPRGYMILQLQQVDDNGTPTGAETPMYQVAIDGITFYNEKPDPVTSGSTNPFMLSPGNRADFIVRISTPGTYQLSKLAVTGINASSQQVLATIVVNGDSGAGGNPVSNATFTSWTNQTIATEGMPKYLCPVQASEIQQNRTINFNTRGAGPGNFPFNASNGNLNATFALDGGRYHDDDQEEMPQPFVNTAEQWTIGQQGNTGLPHPFHIHVNPFQVATTDSFGNSVNRWFDVYPIPAGGVTVKQRFDDYIGKYVMHCHILIHEDMGMMQDVNVRDTEPPTPPPGVGPGVMITLPLADCPTPVNS